MNVPERRKLKRGVYAITEHRRLRFPELLSRTSSILAAGIAALQYRNKEADWDQGLEEAVQLRDLCRMHGTPFIINDDIDLALRTGSDGVHLGRRDGACRAARERLGHDSIIGVSCYNDLDRARQAVADGADYIAFGAMFPSSSKLAATRASPELIKVAKHLYNTTVVAIGGITPDNCVPVIDAGADLLAVISGVYLADDPAGAIDAFNRLI